MKLSTFLAILITGMFIAFVVIGLSFTYDKEYKEDWPPKSKIPKMTCEEALKIDQPAIGTGSLMMECRYLGMDYYLGEKGYCKCEFYSSRHIGWDGEYTYAPDTYDKENLKEVLKFIPKESFYK